VLLAAIAVTLLVLAVWSMLASRAIVQPVRELVGATGRVAAGDLEVRVPASGGAELGELAASFNRMAEDLAQGRARLALAEREKAWAEMARQVAHEIKNPLTPMRMAAQLLLRARREGDARADAIAERLARTVEEQTQELDRIASDFRQFAGAPSRTVESVELDSLVGEVRTAAVALFEAGQLQLSVELHAPGARVQVDRRELQRVFVNLLQNAAQAAGGKVAVRMDTSVVGGRARIVVRDDGPGIPQEVQARLFEPYFTTKTSGTGLGLAICRRIVEQCGGAIRLESTGASGSAFCIELPLSSAN
jgi:nitrogen fixation/metabolism regulation signal transduction histidine kinase